MADQKNKNTKKMRNQWVFVDFYAVFEISEKTDDRHSKNGHAVKSPTRCRFLFRN